MLQVSKLKYLENIKGIDETLDVVKFLAKMVKAVQLSLADGVITVGDGLNFIAPFTALSAALAGISKVPGELTDELTDAEFQKIVDVVIAEGVAPEHAVSVARKILKIAEDIKRLIINDFIRE